MTWRKTRDFGILRPEVIAADVEFFFVDPVHFAVEDGGVGGRW